MRSSEIGRRAECWERPHPHDETATTKGYSGLSLRAAGDMCQPIVISAESWGSVGNGDACPLRLSGRVTVIDSSRLLSTPPRLSSTPLDSSRLLSTPLDSSPTRLRLISIHLDSSRLISTRLDSSRSHSDAGRRQPLSGLFRPPSHLLHTSCHRDSTKRAPTRWPPLALCTL